jgi:hypothetical protein
MNKTILAIALAAVCFTAAAIGGFVARPAQAPTLGSAIDTPIYQYDNATTTVVSGSSQTIVATSTSRRYLTINNAGSISVWCNINGKAAVNQQGFFLTASSSRSFEGASLYTGAIACIAPSGSARVTAIEAY